MKWVKYFLYFSRDLLSITTLQNKNIQLALSAELLAYFNHLECETLTFVKFAM